jgi:hypothetical protein
MVSLPLWRDAGQLVPAFTQEKLLQVLNAGVIGPGAGTCIGAANKAGAMSMACKF